MRAGFRLNSLKYPGLKRDGAQALAELRETASGWRELLGSCCNTRHWHGHATGFLCAHLVSSMFSGNAACGPASYSTTSGPSKVRELLATPASIATSRCCANFMRARRWPSSLFSSTKYPGCPSAGKKRYSFRWGQTVRWRLPQPGTILPKLNPLRCSAYPVGNGCRLRLPISEPR